MKTILSQVAHKGILFFTSAILAVSAQAAPVAGGIHYSDFLNYGGEHYDSLTAEAYFASTPSPVFTAAEPAPPLWGAYFGIIGLVAAIAVSSKALKTTPAPPPPSCSNGGIDKKPTFSRAADRMFVRTNNNGDSIPASIGNYQNAIVTTGEVAGALSAVTALTNSIAGGIALSDPAAGRQNFQYSPNRNAFELVDSGGARAPMVGDVLITFVDDDSSRGFLRRFRSRVYRIYSEGSDLFFAEGEVYSGGFDAARSGAAGVLSCSATAGRFFLDENHLSTTDFDRARSTFSLRDNWRGLIGEQAISIGGFMFSQNDNLHNIHVEHQATPFTSGNFTLHSNSGYRHDSDNSTMTYMQTTATWDLTPSMQLYTQNTGGLLRSNKYLDGRLQAHAVGMFADAVLRHDDSFHVRVEAPLADSRRHNELRAAADMVIGNDENYIRFGLHHDLDDGNFGGQVFYSREF